jgi:molybdopterin/thiamine biosynthesis adenylyltransferase
MEPSELARYERQLRISGFGVEAQRKLKASTVFVSRVGGVGGTAAINLALAGIGRLVLAHGGEVHLDYLNRWVWAGPADVGRPCCEVISQHIRKLNPYVEVVPIPEDVTEENAERLISQGDLVIDGSPVFEERYLMHREAVRQRKPLVMGAMYSTEGYVTTRCSDQSPCLKCLYPERPDYWVDRNVFPAIAPGPLIVGSMSAMEAIKVLTGFGNPLDGVLWNFDLTSCQVRRLKVRKRPDCEFCSEAVAGTGQGDRLQRPSGVISTGSASREPATDLREHYK